MSESFPWKILFVVKSEFVLNVDKMLSAITRYKQVSYTQRRHFIESLGPGTKRKKQVQRRSLGLKREEGEMGFIEHDTRLI